MRCLHIRYASPLRRLRNNLLRCIHSFSDPSDAFEYIEGLCNILEKTELLTDDQKYGGVSELACEQVGMLKYIIPKH